MARKRKVKEVEKSVDSVKTNNDEDYLISVRDNKSVDKETKSSESILEEIENKLDDNREKVKVIEQPSEEIEDINQNNLLDKESFEIDITEYGVISYNTHEFVVNALEFYHENKDKVFVTIENEDVSSKDDKIKEINDKIKKFESKLFKFSYLPKSMVTDFINDLKK